VLARGPVDELRQMGLGLGERDRFTHGWSGF
jgi:hypothetical protein